jgi:WD repeat-containing protein 35
MGLCKEAADCFVKMGDVKRAIDCSVLLNQWHLAVELAEQNGLVQIEPLLQRYAS